MSRRESNNKHSAARYAKAARVVPKVTLNEELAADLEMIMAYWKEGVTETIRGLIFDEATRIRQRSPNWPDDE